MKNIIKIAVSIFVIGIIINPLVPLHSEEDQLFGGKKDKKSESSEEGEEQQLINESTPIKELPKV
jgi:hypothetical protein